jgi:penicillin-binding protein 1A
MAFAHQNLEIRPMPGLSPDGNVPVAFASGRSQASAGAAQGAGQTLAPGTLSRRSYEAIGSIGELLRSVERPGQTQASAGSAAQPAASRVAMP